MRTGYSHFRAGTLFPLLFLASSLFGAQVSSPDGKVVLDFGLDPSGTPQYSVTYQGRPILDQSTLGLSLTGQPSLDAGFEITDTAVTARDTSWKPLYGERSLYRDHCRQLQVGLRLKSDPAARLILTFRSYDEGVAFRYTLPGRRPGESITIASEKSRFRFTGNHRALATGSAQGTYSIRTLSALGGAVERPLVVDVAEKTYAAILEANLVDYARMKIGSSGQANTVESVLGSSVTLAAPFSTPWRIVLLGESHGQLLENNFLALNLSDPIAIPNPAWIKTGRCWRDLGLSTASAKSVVDAAVAHNVQFMEFDAGWYGLGYSQEHNSASDPMSVVSKINIQEVTQYAHARGKGVICYINHVAMEKYDMDKVFGAWKSWGVDGLKFGFVNVGSQRWTRWVHDMVKLAAKHELMVDIHDEYRPTGFSRTYPNLMTQEGVRGDEARPGTDQTLYSAFARSLAGASDFTFRWNTLGDLDVSRAGQLAKPIIFYSPWQFIYWYDGPGIDANDPALEIWKRMPTTWEDTRVLGGVAGQHIAVARKTAQGEWFVGCLSDGARTVDIPLTFLDPGRPYRLKVFASDPANPSRVMVTNTEVNSTGRLQASLRANDGRAFWLVPEGPSGIPLESVMAPAIRRPAGIRFGGFLDDAALHSLTGRRIGRTGFANQGSWNVVGIPPGK